MLEGILTPEATKVYITTISPNQRLKYSLVFGLIEITIAGFIVYYISCINDRQAAIEDKQDAIIHLLESRK